MDTDYLADWWVWSSHRWLVAMVIEARVRREGGASRHDETVQTESHRTFILHMGENIGDIVTGWWRKLKRFNSEKEWHH